MSLRHALLGLLAGQPRSGYELTKAFDSSLAHVWSAGHSQIYPELARLRDDGLILQVEEGPRQRKTYAITKRGLGELRRWIVEEEPSSTPRDDAFLRVFFLWLVEPDEARAYVRRLETLHRATLDRYLEYAKPEPVTREQRVYRMCLDAGLRHERALLAWARWAQTQLDEQPSELASREA